ncbi:MAG: flagellar hook protein FlgE [Bryobacteraceae bacterium]
MFTSFSTALSALNADSTAIDVVGNNLANLNSTGFKSSTVTFSDLVTQSLGAGLGQTQVGFGTATPLTQQLFTQGAIQTSAGVLDSAIQGDGFFVVQNTSGNTYYTRNGAFQTDTSGNLMTNTGDYVQGWTTLNADGTVNTNGPVGNIVVPVGSLNPPVATSTMTADFNLDSSANADSTSAFSMPITVYDSLGTSHTLTMNFQKTAANTWSYQVTIPGADVTAGTAGTPYDTGADGTLNFASDGSLPADTNPSPITISIPGLSDGANDMSITWNLFQSDGVTGRLTQFGESSASSASAQNGSPAAELDQVGIGNGGTVLAEYSDGNEVVVGQIAMASIRNPDSLITIGNDNYELSAETANPSIGVPGTGGRGTVQGGSLEASNVDIATEFTNLIVYQRAYEANAHVVTTADQLSQDTINLIH